MALQDSAMLISLKLTQWSARKLDHGISFEVCKDKQADQGSGTFNKQIIPKKHLADINQLVNKIRNYHYSNTLAWSHKGVDLLPSKNYINYTKRMGEFINKYHTAVDEFLDKYEDIITNVENNLHDMYNKADYPSIEQVRSKFTIEVNTTPVPAAGDFRVDIGKKELDKLKAKLEVQLTEAEDAAEKDLFSRLYTETAKATIALKDPGKIFRNTLIFNVEDIASKIPLMNIKDRDGFNALATNLLTFCKSLDMDKLRKQARYRSESAISMESYLTKVEQLYESINPSPEDNEGKE